METIKKHLARTTDPERIKELTYIVNRGTITLEQWRDTGKFFYASQYKKELSKDCVQVVEYAGGSIIELIKKDNESFIFSIKGTESQNLDKVEDALWKEVCEKLWCENC
jgi:uncharacterized membrane protein